MFSCKGKPIRQATFKVIMNTKMSWGTPIRDHMICMIKLFNEMEILGAKIDRETLVDMVLETWPNSFKQFKLNYFINNMITSLNKLMRELHMVKEILKD